MAAKKDTPTKKELAQKEKEQTLREEKLKALESALATLNSSTARARS